MKTALAVVGIVLGFALSSALAQNSAYSVHIHRVQTKRTVIVSGTISNFRGAEARFETECFSTDTYYPCLVPNLGWGHALLTEQDGNLLIQYGDGVNYYPRQMRATVINLEDGQ